MLSVIERAAVSTLPTVFHMDCTFKCNDNEFPVLVLGVTDAQQQFHPLSISVISHRNTDIYLKCLDAFKTIVAHVVPSMASVKITLILSLISAMRRLSGSRYLLLI